MPSSANLFLSTQRIALNKENLLTEFLAAALRLDAGFRQAYAEIVLARLPCAAGGAVPRIDTVDTQVRFPGRSERPDLVLGLDDGRQVVCEHKIDAPEGAEREYDEIALCQLARYLELPVAAVAYFRATWKSPAGSVIGQSKYLSPTGAAPHFLWRDLYPALQRGDGLVTQWLQDGFRSLGWTPAVVPIGDLDDPDPGRRLRTRENFDKFWDRTRDWLRTQGWTVTSASQCCLVLDENPQSAYARIAIVDRLGGRRLDLRITPREPARIPAITAALEDACARPGPRLSLELATPARAAGKVPIVIAQVAMAELLEGADGPAAITERLLGHVQRVLVALPS